MSHRDEIERIIADAEREAYSRGYADAIAAIAQAAAAHKPSAAVSRESPPGNQTATPANGNGRSRGRPATKAILLVQQAIAAHPGLKGAEITRQLAADGNPVIDRTVRSCLRRLKDRKDIWQRSTRWYSKAKPENEHGETLGTSPQ